MVEGDGRRDTWSEYPDIGSQAFECPGVNVLEVLLEVRTCLVLAARVYAGIWSATGMRSSVHLRETSAQEASGLLQERDQSNRGRM